MNAVLWTNIHTLADGSVDVKCSNPYTADMQSASVRSSRSSRLPRPIVVKVTSVSADCQMAACRSV